MIAKCLLRQKTQKTLTFDYLIPDAITVEPFFLVEVPFRNKKVEAIVLEIQDSSPFAKKEILRALSLGPIITKSQLNIAKRISDEFLSDLPSAIFSFLPKLNKKDLKKIGSSSDPNSGQKVKKPIILTGDYEFRQDYYIQSISKARQNLFIFPEIGDLEKAKFKFLKLDPSLKIELWHSQISPAKKASIWNRLLNKENLIIISSRHGLFLPFINLDLVIIDDPSNFAYFEDQSPRYNAAAAARIVSTEYRSQLIIGDSLPSLESYAWIKSQKAVEVKRQNPIEVKETYELEKIFSDEEFAKDFDASKKILIAGFFSRTKRLVCSDCGADNPLCLECVACKSSNLRSSFFDQSKMELTTRKIFASTSPKTTIENKVTVSAFKEIPSLEKTFDIAIIPYFDSFASFPFLNFRFKLIKHILDLRQSGVRKIYICLSKSPFELADYLVKNEFDQLIIEELKNRKHDQLPPFTRAVELTGSLEDLEKIKTIIDPDSWINQDDSHFVTFISHQSVINLQLFIKKTNDLIQLRFDPPEFA